MTFNIRSLWSNRVRHMVLAVCSAAFINAIGPTAHAQLFGTRTVGSPLGNRAATSPAGADNTGVLSGSERFLRGNRSRRDFVGSDRSEASGFVGASQAIGVGRVPSATEGLQVDSSNSSRINRPLPKLSAKGMYYPRLDLDSLSVSTVTASELESAAEAKLRARVERVAGRPVSLDIDNRIAILRGSVKSTRDAEMLANILSFEPGIDEIRNELKVADQ